MKKFRFLLIFMLGVLLGIFSTPRLGPIREQVSWRVAEIMADIKYAIFPPEEVVFVPEESVSITALPTATTPSGTPTVLLASTNAPLHATPTPTATPLPKSIHLNGFTHEYQTWNNCGPATLAMALSFWGWKGNQQPIAAFTKPNSRDKNVMPYELIDYVEAETDLQAITRVGGDIDLLRRFLAAGFPVMIEKGFELPEDGWMGHYELVTGYDDSKKHFALQDSYFGPDQSMTYSELESNWRAFNFTYLVVYPLERQEEVKTILGSSFNEQYAYSVAAKMASSEISTLAGRDQFFAWFNRGTNLVKLWDYARAAEAYDQAFELYPSIPEKERPWRMMWYQTGPYWAYYYTGRYQDVINLATKTLDAMSEPVLEESYYWRALARVALGDNKKAIKDLRSSLEYHPGFGPALTQLEQLKTAP
jgi:hypothetical protein